MTDEHDVGELVRTFVMPGLVAEPIDPITR
jgi:hypothetical protein